MTIQEYKYLQTTAARKAVHNARSGDGEHFCPDADHKAICLFQVRTDFAIIFLLLGTFMENIGISEKYGILKSIRVPGISEQV